MQQDDTSYFKTMMVLNKCNEIYYDY